MANTCRPTSDLGRWRSVKNTLTRYLRQIEEFEEWLRSKRQRWSFPTLDRKVTQYITHLYDSDAEMSKASYLIYGLQLLKCEGSKDSFLVGSKEALSGWRKQDPGQMRVPVPEEFIFDLMTLALEDDRIDLAMAMLIQFDGYLRPSECLSLTADHVCWPQGRCYLHWALIIAPSTLQQTTKTGQSDDSILLGDRPHNGWIKECMRLFMKTVKYELFPGLTLSGYETWCRQACLRLSYKRSCVMPHIIRHAAASNDMYHSRRSLVEIQKRGRWAAKRSVSRYEKHALLLAQWRQVSPHRKSLVEAQSQSIKSTLLTALRTNG